MLKNRLLHPEILRSLATAGHGSKVLIADGNYPYRTGANPDADRVYLNFSPGVLNTVEVLEVLAAEIPIEAAEVMLPASGEEPAIFAEFRSCLPAQMDLNYLNRFEFYESARCRDTSLVIATGEQRVFACILLTIGVVPPDAW